MARDPSRRKASGAVASAVTTELVVDVRSCSRTRNSVTDRYRAVRTRSTGSSRFSSTSSQVRAPRVAVALLPLRCVPCRTARRAMPTELWALARDPARRAHASQDDPRWAGLGGTA